MTHEIDELIARRQRLLGHAYCLFYDQPLHIVRGDGVWLFDADGRRYLDSYNNVPHVGHCHPLVVEAICRQAATLNTHTRYLHETVLDYAERLLDRFSPNLDTAMFACTGSEANELALRLAAAASGGRGVIAVADAYHGNSRATEEISERSLGDTTEDHVVMVPCPDTYRGPHRGPDAGEHYAAEVARAIETLHERGHRPAAFIIDTILSSNGVPRIPSDWLPRVLEIIREAGGLFIADEVQPGFGRTGSHFWGFDLLGVTPDIITMGKPMGNGHPISAVVTSSELTRRFRERSDYFNTFGGNPVACAAAAAVLDVLEQDRLQDNARDTGAYLRARLQELAGRHALIGDVRGHGLYNSVDLVTDRETRTPASGAAHRVVNGMRDRGVLIGVSGAGENVLKLRSPMIFERQHADLLVSCLDDCLAELAPA